MKTRITLIAAALLLVGCSRTPDDVARWKTNSNVDKLIDALEDPKVEIRTASAAALGSLKAERSVQALGALYNDPDNEAVLAAVEALAAIGSESTATPLIAALKMKNAQARIIATQALGNLGSPRGIDALAAALNDSKANIRLAAARALGQITDEKSAPPLINQLKSQELRIACSEALTAIGTPAVPHLLTALKSEETIVRREAINILEKLSAVPNAGSDHTWFLLARVSVEDHGTVDPAVVEELASAQIETLLQAAAHPVADFREHAFQALQNIGKPCIDQAIVAASTQASTQAQSWFHGRNRWVGAPNWHIDLWAAVAALNPAFGESREQIPAWIAQQEKRKLAAAGQHALFPLMAASLGKYPVIADQAAELLGELGDPRAAQPLMDVFKRKLSVNTALTRSPFYTALLQLDIPAAEPLLLRVRPNPLRAMRVLERSYPQVRAISAESRDDPEELYLPISFRVGYIDEVKMNEVTITFAKDWQGDWNPDPALPNQLSQ